MNLAQTDPLRIGASNFFGPNRAELIPREPFWPVLANAIVALRAAPEWEGVLAFDEFELQPTTLRSAPWSGPARQRWNDHEDRLTAEWLQRHGIMVTTDIAGQAVETVARDRSYHPIRSYLASLTWDGVERIDRWLAAYLGADENEYIRAVGSRWLISAVARVYQPGVKADCCLILEGPRGERNRQLCARWLASTSPMNWRTLGARMPSVDKTP